MGVLDRAYEIDALALSYGPGESDIIGVISGANDPSQSPGVDAPDGTLFINTLGELWQKNGIGDTDWKRLLPDDGSTTLEKVVYREEFLPSGASPFFDTEQWNFGTSGAGSSVLGVVSQGGQIKIAAGPANGRYAELYWSHEVFKKEDEVIFEFYGRLDITSDIVATLGLWEPGSDHAAYFQVSNGGTEFETYVAGSSNTTIDSGVLLDTSMHFFKIITASDKITFLIDSEIVAEHESNLPTNRLKADFYIESKNTGATRSFFLDAVRAVAKREV
jgi:hypothetical protein